MMKYAPPPLPSPRPKPESQSIMGLTKEEVAFRRRLAAHLAQQASDTSPVRHWTQGAARLVQGMNAAGHMAAVANAGPSEEDKLDLELKRAQLARARSGGESGMTAHQQAQMDLAERKFALEVAQAGQMTPYQQAMLEIERARLGSGRGQGVPSGYQQAEGGGVEPIPGGPEDVEAVARRKAAVTLPQTEQSVQTVIANIDGLIAHPAFDRSVGSFQGSVVPSVSSGARDVDARIRQLRGGAMMMAVESLRGLGAMSDREGAAAQEALARLDPTMGEAEFRTALNEFREFLNARLEVARRMAGQSPANASPQAGGSAPGQGARLRFNPATGEIE